MIKEKSIIKLNSTCKHMNEVAAVQSGSSESDNPLSKRDGIKIRDINVMMLKVAIECFCCFKVDENGMLRFGRNPHRNRKGKWINILLKDGKMKAEIIDGPTMMDNPDNLVIYVVDDDNVKADAGAVLRILNGT